MNTPARFYGNLETYAKAVESLAKKAGMTSAELMRERLTWELNEETARLVRLHCPHVFLNAGMEAFFGIVFEINTALPDGLHLNLLSRSARYEASAVSRWGYDWIEKAPKPCSISVPFVRERYYLPSRHPGCPVARLVNHSANHFSQ